MTKTVKEINKLTPSIQSRIKDLGVDYGFETFGSGDGRGSGFTLERIGKTCSGQIVYTEYKSHEKAKIELLFECDLTVVNKKELLRASEIASGMAKIIDVIEKAAGGTKVSGGDGVWRSRV